MVYQPGMPVEIEIDGKPYTLRYTLKVLKELQKDHGISVIRGASDAVFDAEKLALILFYGLRTKAPELTLDWVEDNIDTGMLVAMLPTLVFAMTGQQPKQPPNADRPAQSGTGSPSGPSDDTTLASVNGHSGS